MTENKVEILPLVAEDHELIKTKLDEFNFDKDDAEKLEDTLINCMDFYRGLGLSANQIGINARAFAMVHEEQPMVMFQQQKKNILQKKDVLHRTVFFQKLHDRKVSQSIGKIKKVMNFQEVLLIFLLELYFMSMII